MDYSFKKSTYERYDIRWSQCGWAIINIDENGGVFNAQSDYNNYSYSWPHHGRKSFKHFIIELAKDKSYFLGKVSNRSYFNYEESLKSWERAIIEMRREYDCTKEQARNVWDFIHSLDDYSGSQHLTQLQIYESDAIREICPEEPWYMFDTIMEYPHSARAFAEEVMPMLAEILKNEILEQEQA